MVDVTPKAAAPRSPDEEASSPAAAARTRGLAAPRLALVLLAALYLAGVWLDGIGTSAPARLLPRPVLYFLQVASLFTRAGAGSVGYRAEVWLCDERRWVEVDVRPYFPIDRDTKESRFHRALHFLRRHRRSMEALERYVIASYERGRGDDGLRRAARVGGARFSRTLVPLPKPGATVARWRYRPLADYPREQRRRLYWTPRDRRAERCGGPTPNDTEDD